MVTAPSFSVAVQTAWNSSTSPKSTGSFSAAVGDVFASAIGVENGNSAPNYTWANTGTNQTWEEKTAAPASPAISKAWAQAATTTVADTLTTQTISATRTAGDTGVFFGLVAAKFTGSDGIGATNQSDNGSSSSAPSFSFTTSYDNSAVFVLVVDWNAADGASRTWRTINGYTPTAGNGQELSYFRNTTNYAAYAAYYPDVGAAGAKTLGLTAPATMRWVLVAVEVRGATGATNYNGTGTANLTAAISAAGTMDAAGTASRPSTVAMTATGVVGKVATATLALTTAITATGIVGTSQSANTLTETVTTTTSGTTGAVTGAAATETVTTTATGIVDVHTGATPTWTFGVDASGAVVSSGSGQATANLTDTITATGVVATSAGAAPTLTFGVTTTGIVGVVGGATVPLTYGTTATGATSAPGSGSATVPLTFGTTTTGVVAKTTTASSPLTYGTTTTGEVGKLTGANLPVTVTTTATGAFGKTAGANTITPTVGITATGTITTATNATIPLTAAITATGTVVGYVPPPTSIAILTGNLYGTTITGDLQATTLTGDLT